MIQGGSIQENGILDFTELEEDLNQLLTNEISLEELVKRRVYTSQTMDEIRYSTVQFRDNRNEIREVPKAAYLVIAKFCTSIKQNLPQTQEEFNTAVKQYLDYYPHLNEFAQRQEILWQELARWFQGVHQNQIDFIAQFKQCKHACPILASLDLKYYLSEAGVKEEDQPVLMDLILYISRLSAEQEVPSRLRAALSLLLDNSQIMRTFLETLREILKQATLGDPFPVIEKIVLECGPMLLYRTQALEYLSHTDQGLYLSAVIKAIRTNHDSI